MILEAYPPPLDGWLILILWAHFCVMSMLVADTYMQKSPSGREGEANFGDAHGAVKGVARERRHQGNRRNRV